MMVMTIAQPAGGSLLRPLLAPRLVGASPPSQVSYPASSCPHCRSVRALASNSPKGFGPPSPVKKRLVPRDTEDSPRGGSVLEDEEDDEVPEVITNRMLKRIGFTVGVPLSIGILFFPFFYYLKVGLKLDLPEVLPVAVSGLLFGTSGLGITYGIISTSWDPLREGSLLGWTEAKANWPVFFQNMQRKEGKK